MRGRDALDVAGACRGDGRGRCATPAGPGVGRLRHLRGRRRPVGPQGPAARPAAAPAARRGPRRGPGLRQRRVHHLRRRPARATSSTGWVAAQRHPAGQDQDRRVLGQPTTTATWPGCARPATSSAPDVELFVDANGGYTAQAGHPGDATRPTTWTCAGSRSRSPPTTSTACARSATPCAPTSPPASTATTWPTSGACARPARSTACRPTPPAAAASPSGCGSPPSPPSYGLEVSGHCAPHLHAHVAAAVPNLRHLEWFHDHVRIESMFFDGTLDPHRRRDHAPTRTPRARAHPARPPTRNATGHTVGSRQWQTKDKARQAPCCSMWTAPWSTLTTCTPSPGGRRSPRPGTTCRWRTSTGLSAWARTRCWTSCCPATGTRDADAGIRTSHTRLYATYWSRLRPLPGAVELLRACKAPAWRWCWPVRPTSRSPSVLRAVLDAEDAIDDATFSGDVDASKPAPDLVQVALDKAGVPAGAGGVRRRHGLGRAGLPEGRGAVHRPAQRRHQPRGAHLTPAPRRSTPAPADLLAALPREPARPVTSDPGQLVLLHLGSGRANVLGWARGRRVAAGRDWNTPSGALDIGWDAMRASSG